MRGTLHMPISGGARSQHRSLERLSAAAPLHYRVDPSRHLLTLSSDPNWSGGCSKTDSDKIVLLRMMGVKMVRSAGLLRLTFLRFHARGMRTFLLLQNRRNR
jgi:hypothetical protein